MDDKVVKHRNYAFLYILTAIFCVLAAIAGLYYFNASMDHTTIIEKGFIAVYKAIISVVSAIAGIF